MLLGNFNNIENSIVIYLAKNGYLSALKLQTEISKNIREVSLQAIYKELRKLIEQGVVWKNKNYYGLSATWVINFSQLADSMYYNLTENNSEKILPQNTKEKKVFNFSSLSRVDDFWMHVIFLSLQNSNRKQIYQWLPHPWFNIINSHKSYPLQKALKSVSYSVKNIVGGNTFLDLNANKISTPGAYEYSYAEGPFEELQDTYYSCSDTFLFTIKISKEKVTLIEKLYNNCSSLDDLEIDMIEETINKPSNIKTNIEYKTRKQLKIWKEFCRYFEV